jgi:PEP-CTERM motif
MVVAVGLATKTFPFLLVRYTDQSMSIRALSALVVSTAFFAFSQPAYCDILPLPPIVSTYDETLPGQGFSMDALNPTRIDQINGPFQIGTNVIKGIVGGANQIPSDWDLFTIQIPAGLQIKAIYLTSLNTQQANLSYLAMDFGTQFDFDGGANNLSQALAMSVFNPSLFVGGTNFGDQPGNWFVDPLPTFPEIPWANLVNEPRIPPPGIVGIGATNGSVGTQFSSLGTYSTIGPHNFGGEYFTFLIQEADSFSEYELSFIVSAVPEPSSALLVVFGIAGMMRRRNRTCLMARAK